VRWKSSWRRARQKLQTLRRKNQLSSFSSRKRFKAGCYASGLFDFNGHLPPPTVRSIPFPSSATATLITWPRRFSVTWCFGYTTVACTFSNL
jgi:hypothetical protein